MDRSIELILLVLKFGMDEDYNQFDLQEFLYKICNIFRINLNDLVVIGQHTGSAIVIAELFNKFKSSEKQIKITTLYKSLTDRLKRELGKLQTFFMYMGIVESSVENKTCRAEIQVYPDYIRTYGKGYAYWVGDLKDGKDHGDVLYYYPIG